MRLTHLLRINRRRATIVVRRLFVSVICLVASPAFAAIPIEESVEEAREGQPTPSPAPAPPPTRTGGSLDIPPTIEPTSDASQPRPLNTNVTVGSSSATYGSAAQAAPRSVTPQASSGEAGLSQLFYKIQVLEQEVQTLRGQLEEQTHLVQRLQRDQKEQYVDLDQRIVALGAGGRASTGGAPPSASGAPSGGSSTGAIGGNLSERDLYKASFDAMRARQFDESLQGFRQLIERYPNGQYTPNAYYWIGELQLVGNSDAEAARQSFMQVISLYPDHQKAPDALYKLGVAYHTLGDTPTALTYLQRVQEDYPDSPAAGLAEKYAAELR